MIPVERLRDDLPVFLIDRENEPILYAPGYLVVPPPQQLSALEMSLTEPAPGSVTAQKLLQRATDAKQEYFGLAAASYEPNSLIIYVGNRCNLACSYCFARPWERDGDATQTVSPQATEIAARHVARNCAERGLPLRVVVSGGGEPTIYDDLPLLLAELTRRVADEYGVPWWGYMATNGVMGRERAIEAAATFDLIGLSCDGPPEVHNPQRPDPEGEGTYGAVMRTAETLHEHGARFITRSTITPDSFESQPEIALWICDHMAPDELRFEPAYRIPGQGAPHFAREDASTYAAQFDQAQRAVAERGGRLRYSGVRIDEIHGAYCELLRESLQLNPDGSLSGCFTCPGGCDNTTGKLIIGDVDVNRGSLTMDQKRIDRLRRRSIQVPRRCHDCVNIYHCVRDCPEVCSATNPMPDEPSFRCLLNRELALGWIRQAACTMRQMQM